MNTYPLKITLIALTFMTLSQSLAKASDFQKCLEKFTGTYTSDSVLIHIGKIKGCKKCYKVRAIVKGEGPNLKTCFKELHGKTLSRYIGGSNATTKDKKFFCDKNTLKYVAKFKFPNPVKSQPGEIDKGHGLIKQVEEESIYVLKGKEIVNDHFEKRTYISGEGKEAKEEVRQFQTVTAETYKKVSSSSKDFDKKALEEFISKNCADRKPEFFKAWTEEDLTSQWAM